MKKLLSSNRSITEIATVLLLLAFGIAILVKPAAIVSLSVAVVLGLMALLGIVWLIRYLRMPALEAAQTSYLAGSLAIFTVGIVFFFNRNLFEAVLPRLWGMVEIIGAFLLVQMAVDFLRLRIDRWWIMLIGAGISLILGLLAVIIPDFLAPHLAVFIGISLIAESLIHLTSIILLALAEKKKEGTSAAGQSAEQAPAAGRNDMPLSEAAGPGKDDGPFSKAADPGKDDEPFSKAAGPGKDDESLSEAAASGKSDESFSESADPGKSDESLSGSLHFPPDADLSQGADH